MSLPLHLYIILYNLTEWTGVYNRLKIAGAKLGSGIELKKVGINQLASVVHPDSPDAAATGESGSIRPSKFILIVVLSINNSCHK